MPLNLAHFFDVSTRQERHHDCQNFSVQDVVLDVIIEERMIHTDPIRKEPVWLRLACKHLDQTKDNMRLCNRERLSTGQPDLLPNPFLKIRNQLLVGRGILEHSAYNSGKRKRHQIGNRAANVILRDLLVLKHPVIFEVIHHGIPLMRGAAERIGKNHAVRIDEVRAIAIQNGALHALPVCEDFPREL